MPFHHNFYTRQTYIYKLSIHTKVSTTRQNIMKVLIGISVYFIQQNKSLKVLYGKNKASAKKIQAAKLFGKSHSNIKCIAKALQVEIPTAEVYLIDAYCAGAPMVSIEKPASELNIHSHLTNTIARLIEQGLPTLRQIRDVLNRKV